MGSTERTSTAMLFDGELDVGPERRCGLVYFGEASSATGFDVVDECSTGSSTG